MSELLKTLPNGQWNLEKALCSACHKDPCECDEESDCMKNVNASYSMDPNSVQMSEREFLKFSSTGSGQWSICKAKDPMANRTTAVPGVSERGIEVRRASKKVPADKLISHGYARVTSPEKHLETAKQIGRAELADTKAVKKPKLP
jgi:hypothetical protein